MPERAQRLVFAGFCALFTCPVGQGCGGVVRGGVWRLGGRRSGGVATISPVVWKWRLWKLDGRLGGQLDGHFFDCKMTQKAAFLTERGDSLAVF